MLCLSPRRARVGQGPSDPSKRKTTDCLCVILIAAMWFSLTIIGFIVCGVIESADLPPGDPAKLTHMLDYDGGICAVTSGVEDKPYAYFLPSGQVRTRAWVGLVGGCFRGGGWAGGLGTPKDARAFIKKKTSSPPPTSRPARRHFVRRALYIAHAPRVCRSFAWTNAPRPRRIPPSCASTTCKTPSTPTRPACSASTTAPPTRLANISAYRDTPACARALGSYNYGGGTHQRKTRCI